MSAYWFNPVPLYRTWMCGSRSYRGVLLGSRSHMGQDEWMYRYASNLYNWNWWHLQSDWQPMDIFGMHAESK